MRQSGGPGPTEVGWSRITGELLLCQIYTASGKYRHTHPNRKVKKMNLSKQIIAWVLSFLFPLKKTPHERMRASTPKEARNAAANNRGRD